MGFVGGILRAEINLGMLNKGKVGFYLMNEVTGLNR